MLPDFYVKMSIFAHMKFWTKMGLAALSGILFTLAWPEKGVAPFIFIAFVPLLFISYQHKIEGRSTLQITLFAYIAFLIWNALTTYWVYFSSEVGGIAAVVILSLFFATVYTAFQFTYKLLPGQWGLLTLPVYWIAFEKFHLWWDLSWPWLTVGNVFSEYYTWVQWYEFTGVFGGTLWVFAINILVFLAIKSYKEKSQMRGWQYSSAVLGLVAIPVILSLNRYSAYVEKSDPVDIVVVQPNIDPYKEKFRRGTEAKQNDKFIALARQKMDTKVDYLVGPETSLAGGIEERYINSDSEIIKLRKLLRKYPQAALVTGASTVKFYESWEIPSSTATKSKNGKFSFDDYNTALYIDTSQTILYSHKAKLVPGVERMPLAGKLGFIEDLAIDMGGASGSLGYDTIQMVFPNRNKKFCVAPSICYESVYGEYMGAFINKGANVMFIITNDGWWGNTPGHRQHCSYARLRAIESRRSIARSANTGISCFVNQRGDISQATEYWVPAVIRQTINANSELTFYTKHGDYIAAIFTWITIMLLPALIVLQLVRKWKNRKRKKAKA